MTDIDPILYLYLLGFWVLMILNENEDFLNYMYDYHKSNV